MNGETVVKDKQNTLAKPEKKLRRNSSYLILTCEYNLKLYKTSRLNQ